MVLGDVNRTSIPVSCSSTRAYDGANIAAHQAFSATSQNTPAAVTFEGGALTCGSYFGEDGGAVDLILRGHGLSLEVE